MAYHPYLQIGKAWWGALVDEETTKLIHFDTRKWTNNRENFLSTHIIRCKSFFGEEIIVPRNMKFPYCGARRLERLEPFNWSVVVRRGDLRLKDTDDATNDDNGGTLYVTFDSFVRKYEM